MAGCPKCGMSGIGLATHGHGEPCKTQFRREENAAHWESALKDIAELAKENGAEWAARRALRALE